MHWCIPASGCNSGIRDKHRVINGFAMARTPPQTDSAIWALGKHGCGWHFASPPVSATMGFRWSTEFNPGLNIRGVWEKSDSCGIQIKACYPLRADSVWLSASPSLPDAPSLLLAVKSRHSGAAKEMPEVQGQYWYPDFITHWQWHRLFAANWSHTQENAVTALVTKAAHTELLPAGPGNTAEAKFITVTPEINLASETMASCN